MSPRLRFLDVAHPFAVAFPPDRSALSWGLATKVVGDGDTLHAGVILADELSSTGRSELPLELTSGVTGRIVKLLRLDAALRASTSLPILSIGCRAPASNISHHRVETIMADGDSEAKLDLSDVEWRLGQRVGGGQLWEPCNKTDIRRWVMALDYVNPLHWDQRFAQKTKFGDIIAPQSMAVALDYGHGNNQACVGVIKGQHMIFGGEEWWWYGTHIRPGDQLFQERIFTGYKVADTKFAGPTLFQRGDTIHRNQRGDLIAKSCPTVIRYLAKEAEKRGIYAATAGAPKRWTLAELAQIDAIRRAWFMSNREGKSPLWTDVQVGDKLPRRVIGPHSIASFTTEYRAFIFNIWGSFYWTAPEGVENPWVNQDMGWIEGFSFDEEGAMIDPRLRDGLYVGPSRGHIDDSRASEIGMHRAYGYGATMAAWNTDYLAFWAGHNGLVRHAKSEFRGPAFEGDVTYVDGEVVQKIEKSDWGFPIVQVKVTMINQDGKIVVSSLNEVELPY